MKRNHRTEKKVEIPIVGLQKQTDGKSDCRNKREKMTLDQAAISQHCERENGLSGSVFDDLSQDSSMTFYITRCHNVTVQTGASFNMKQGTVQKTCECIVTSTANIAFDITDCKNMSQ